MEKSLFELEVKELGIVKDAKISLKPFTIFFGKNNTGKTYMAYLVYGICNITEPITEPLSKYIMPTSTNVSVIKEALKNIIVEKYVNSKIHVFEFTVNHEYLISDNYICSIFNNDIRMDNIKFKLNLPKKIKLNFYIERLKAINDKPPDEHIHIKNIRNNLTRFGKIFSKSGIYLSILSDSIIIGYKIEKII